MARNVSAAVVIGHRPAREETLTKAAKLASHHPGRAPCRDRGQAGSTGGRRRSAPCPCLTIAHHGFGQGGQPNGDAPAVSVRNVDSGRQTRTTSLRLGRGPPNVRYSASGNGSAVTPAAARVCGGRERSSTGGRGSCSPLVSGRGLPRRLESPLSPSSTASGCASGIRAGVALTGGKPSRRGRREIPMSWKPRIEVHAKVGAGPSWRAGQTSGSRRRR